MTPKYPYGKKSMEFLLQTKKKLQAIFLVVANIMNTTILPSTIRTPEQQLEYFRRGVSKTLKSRHLTGDAVDAAPWPVDWRTDRELLNVIEDALKPKGIFDEDKFKDILNNIKRWYEFVGVVKGVSEAMGIPIRHGRDFNKFLDLPHTELKEK